MISLHPDILVEAAVDLPVAREYIDSERVFAPLPQHHLEYLVVDFFLKIDLLRDDLLSCIVDQCHENPLPFFALAAPKYLTLLRVCHFIVQALTFNINGQKVTNSDSLMGWNAIYACLHCGLEERYYLGA